jgi:hypothetical protein
MPTGSARAVGRLAVNWRRFFGQLAVRLVGRAVPDRFFLRFSFMNLHKLPQTGDRRSVRCSTQFIQLLSQLSPETASGEQNAVITHKTCLPTTSPKDFTKPPQGGFFLVRPAWTPLAAGALGGCQANTSASAKHLPCWSLADKAGALSMAGHSMPMVGSSHAMQRSCAGA